MENRKDYLHLDDLKLTDFDALIIAKILKYNSNAVKLLDLNNNPDIGDIGLSHVCKHVIAPSSPIRLRSLFMSGCGITDQGIHELISPLRWAEQSMHILELRKNQITDDGVEIIAQALSRPGTINTPQFSLFLNSNPLITDRGAIALAKAVIESEGRLKVWLKDTCVGLSEDEKKDIMKITKNHLKF